MGRLLVKPIVPQHEVSGGSAITNRLASQGLRLWFTISRAAASSGSIYGVHHNKLGEIVVTRTRNLYHSTVYSSECHFPSGVVGRCALIYMRT